MKASMSLIKREVQPLVGGGYETSPEGSGPFRTYGKAHSEFNYLAKAGLLRFQSNTTATTDHH